MRIGIFFGGQSLEREVSFAGGRTVFDNLDKNIFDPCLIFVDSLGNFIHLDWKYIYKGSIRDFYPPHQPLGEISKYIESFDNLSLSQIDSFFIEIGKRIYPHEFSVYFDFAFLALHGPQGEDGAIQGLLEWHNIPYSGSGIFGSAFGIDKFLQRKLMAMCGYGVPKSVVLAADTTYDTEAIAEKLGFPLVVKPTRQGSSVGVSIVNDIKQLPQAIEKAFFIYTLEYENWNACTQKQKKARIAKWIDVRTGFGMPVVVDGQVIYSPDKLIDFLDENLTKDNSFVKIQALQHDNFILLEQFIAGKEFSCIVIENEKGEPIALPPTEIIKKESFFDYRAKYLPGMARKVTPIDLPDAQIAQIIHAAEKMFIDFSFDVYARIDGFITNEGEIYLNDPNTTSGMMPSSFFFHQAAEIGLNPSQFLTYIISTSLQASCRNGKNIFAKKILKQRLISKLISSKNDSNDKIKVAVIMGGYSSERHISVESGRNIYEKLSSSTKYQLIPIFLTGSPSALEIYQIPINYLLKDNADDIVKKIKNPYRKPIVDEIKQKASSLTHLFAQDAIFEPIALSFGELKDKVDKVFIALHGRPGEDGHIQTILEQYGISYNGSGPKSAALTIDKYQTNEILRKNGIKVANHFLALKQSWIQDKNAFVAEIEKIFSYPLIAKPYDDGCSTGVKKINNTDQLIIYSDLIFRDTEDVDPQKAQTLSISPAEELPRKEAFLVEELIEKGGSQHFLEITGGFLVRKTPAGKQYEMFEASEALAVTDILSLEEKFLAGEGQNITPARYDPDPIKQQQISQMVKDTFQKVAQILDIDGYARIDAFVKIYPDRTDIYIIEVNSLPGMTPATVIFHQAALAGYTPFDFIDAILENCRP